MVNLKPGPDGQRRRKKVSGKNKTEVRAKLAELSDNGMAIEEISRLVGHSSSNVTETVYRHQIRPVITVGAEAMDKISANEHGSPVWQQLDSPWTCLTVRRLRRVAGCCWTRRYGPFELALSGSMRLGVAGRRWQLAAS